MGTDCFFYGLRTYNRIRLQDTVDNEQRELN